MNQCIKDPSFEGSLPVHPALKDSLPGLWDVEIIKARDCLLSLKGVSWRFW